MHDPHEGHDGPPFGVHARVLEPGGVRVAYDVRPA